MGLIDALRAARLEFEALAAAHKTSTVVPQMPRSGGGATTPPAGSPADALRRNTPDMVALLAELDKRYGRK